jgi:hypothetical protein
MVLMGFAVASWFSDRLPGFSELPISGTEKVNSAIQNHARSFKIPCQTNILYPIIRIEVMDSGIKK